jgi:CDP-diacylglycerol--glycerol-3-phosphate 3-phosphatidyltransferase
VERVTIFGLGVSVFTLLLICGIFFVALVAYCFLALIGKRPRSAEIQARGETVFLPFFVRDYWDWVISPVTRFLIKIQINPNVITWCSFAVAAGAGLAFGVGYFGLGGWLYILSGTLDMFDGKVARATGQATKAGAFIDSVLDRYTEIFVLSGLAYHFRQSAMLGASLAAIAGSLMVSYTRARGEGLGYSYREGGMQRAERIVYLGLSGVLGKVADAAWPSRQWDVLFISFALTLLAFSTNFTAIQRFFGIVRALREADGGPGRHGNIIRPSFLKRVGQ